MGVQRFMTRLTAWQTAADSGDETCQTACHPPCGTRTVGPVVPTRPPTRHKRFCGPPTQNGPSGDRCATVTASANAEFGTTHVVEPAEPPITADRRAQSVAVRGPVAEARAGC